MKLAKILTAARLRNKDPEVIKARESLRQNMLGKRRRKLKATSPGLTGVKATQVRLM